jgi:ADP-heptose:LPS heptosyltransferase
MEGSVKLDCRFYLGDRPCRHHADCAACDHYVPMGRRVVVIKLAAAGDVLRATAILPPLKKKFDSSHVTWVADATALPLLEGNPFVDRAMPMGFETWLVLSREKFDLAVCLDKEPRAAALLMSVDADTRLGFGLSRWGTIEALNEGARYDLMLGLSDDMKFCHNEKTYPEIFCDIAEVDHEGEPYVLTLPESSIARAQAFIERLGVSQPLVGLNVGAGGVFANKAWTPEGHARLACLVANELGGTALVLGGPDDRERALETLRLAGGKALDGGVHDLLDFCALVGSVDALVTGDTMAMHAAIALRVPVVVIVGPTVPQEIAIYGSGRKIVSPAACAPCYRRFCDVSPSCMDAIDVSTIFEALREVLEEA